MDFPQWIRPNLPSSLHQYHHTSGKSVGEITTAAKAGDLVRVETLTRLFQPGGILLQDALFEAVKKNHVAIARYLLERGARISHKPRLVAYASSLEMISLLQEYGWDISLISSGRAITWNTNPGSYGGAELLE
jgi:hypothetical protein